MLLIEDGIEDIILESDDKAEIGAKYVSLLSTHPQAHLSVVEVQHKELKVKRYESNELSINLDINF